MRKFLKILAVVFIAGMTCCPAFAQVGVRPSVNELTVLNNRPQSAARFARSARSATGVSPVQSRNATNEEEENARASNATTRSARSASSGTPVRSVASGTTARSATTAPTPTSTRQTALGTQRTARSATSSALTATPSRVARSAASTTRVPVSSSRTTTQMTTRTARSARSATASPTPVYQTYYEEDSYEEDIVPTQNVPARISAPSNYIPRRLPTTSTAGVATSAPAYTDVKACQTQYYACMDEFCDDSLTQDDSVVGRCLCSSSYQTYFARKNELESMIRRINQMIDAVAGLELKSKTGQIGGAVYQTLTQDIATELGFNQLDTSNLSDDVDYGDTADASLRVGKSLYDAAHFNCKRFLEFCPQTGMDAAYMTNQYLAQIDKSCRVYDKDLTTKNKEYTLKIQKIYNQYQAKENEIAAQNNIYNESQCWTHLRDCMLDKNNCDEGFKYCRTESMIENQKPACSSILDKCQKVSDNVWNTLKQQILERYK
ncbi:MAG: hypothetical protein LBR35_00075 [Rickettsiales bacterium]|jgi:hypothetical protein|nr:hypothetical protein [Rickettsiales bacterium]